MFQIHKKPKRLQRISGNSCLKSSPKATGTEFLPELPAESSPRMEGKPRSPSGESLPRRKKSRRGNSLHHRGPRKGAPALIHNHKFYGI